MVLELVMEMLDERLVSMVVADEVRIILDRCGGAEVNQGIADSGDLPGGEPWLIELRDSKIIKKPREMVVQGQYPRTTSPRGAGA
jgi:hypothetical protein